MARRRKGRELRILHVTQCRDDDVLTAIDLLAEVDTAHTQLLLTPEPAAHRARMFAEIGSIGTGLGAVRTLRRAIRELRPDVVHAHSGEAGLTARTAMLGVPVVYQPHGFGFDDSTRPTIVRAAVRTVETRLAPRTAAFVVLTPHEQRLAHSLGSGGPAVIVPHRPSMPGGLRADLPRVAATPPVVATIGRISAQQDPAFVARVARLVRAVRPEVSFVWVGEGDPALAAVLTGAGVRITGRLSEAARRQELVGADVYLHAAVHGGFPLSVLDAALLRRPVVARRTDAFADCPVVTFPHESDCAAAILRMMTNPARRASLVAAGERLLVQMNSATMAAGLERAYGTVSTRPRVPVLRSVAA